MKDGKYNLQEMLHKQNVYAICPLMLYPACQCTHMTVEVHVGASW